jgi:signal transduction histidine kinase
MSVNSSAAADAHGGRIWADSSGEKQGTTVSVWLPTTDQTRRTPAR